MSKANSTNQWPDKSKLYKDDDGNIKECFCVGPKNCDDDTCILVKRYKLESKGETQ